MNIESILKIHKIEKSDLTENELSQIKKLMSKFDILLEDLNKCLLVLEEDSKIEVDLKEAITLLEEENV